MVALPQPPKVLGVVAPDAGGTNILPTMTNARQINKGSFQALMTRVHISPENNLPEIDT